MYGYDCTAKAIPDTLNNTKRYTNQDSVYHAACSQMVKAFYFCA